MRKIPLFILLTITLFSISIISAAQIDFTKTTTSFDSGETLIAKISANFVENPTRENVFFYRDGNIPVSFEYEVANIENDFYIYAILDKPTKNYTLSIENIEYMNGVEVSSEPIKKDFTITNNTASFSVKPGFIDSSSDFFIEVQNLKTDTITVQIAASDNFNQDSSIDLLSGEIKEIPFYLSGQDNSFTEQIEIYSGNTRYFIPVFVNYFGSSSNLNGSSTTSTNSETNLDFTPNRISAKMATNSESRKVVYLINSGNSEVESFDFLVSENLKDYVEITSSKDSLLPDSSAKIEITITSGSEEKVIEGEIIVESENDSSTLDVVLNIEADYVPSEAEISEEESALMNCADLKGFICSKNEKCSSEVTEVKDGPCCLTSCSEVKKSSTGKIIGWTMIGIVLIFILWFFKRYKRVRPKVDLLKIAGK